MAGDNNDDRPSHNAIAHPLRLLLIASFVPAFPLCVAHGVQAHWTVPALGLLPLAVSAIVAALLLRFHRSTGPGGDDDGHDGEVDQGERQGEDEGHSQSQSIRAQLTHPVAVFAYDLVLAAALMVVLVFTWITANHFGSSSLVMLGAYATLPLLLSFFIHLYLALLAFAHGLAVQGLFRWAAWRVLPPDCPNCNAHLRPDLPEFPWLRRGRRGQHRGGDGGDYAPVFVSEQNRYRDHVEGDDDAAAVPSSAAEPEAVEVRRKKGRTAPASEPTPWAS